MSNLRTDFLGNTVSLKTVGRNDGAILRGGESKGQTMSLCIPEKPDIIRTFRPGLTDTGVPLSLMLGRL